VTYYVDPPAWLLVACGVIVVLPLSALAGLSAAWLFDRFTQGGPSPH
jgi:hypothetical protein